MRNSMLAFTTDDDEAPPASGTARSTPCLLRAGAVARIVEAIYAGLEDLEAWSEEVTAVTAQVLGHRENDLRLSIVDRWVGDMYRTRRDEVHVVGHPGRDESVVLTIPCGRAGRLTPYDRVAIGRVVLHLENAARFLRAPHAVRAHLSMDGEILEPAFPGASTSGRTAPQIEIWRALVEGRVTLVPRADGYRLLESMASWRERRALTALELEVVMHSARGTSGKESAYLLGVSTGRTCRALADAAAKMGAKTSSDLVRLAARLAIDDAPELCDAVLTVAEREVLDLVRIGMSNEEIAEARGRSPRTVANQVASLLRKTGRGSRRALSAARPIQSQT